MRERSRARQASSWRKSPVVQGALPVIGIAAALIVLLVVGSLLGVHFARRSGGVRGAGLPSAEATSSVVAGGDGLPGSNTSASKTPGGDETTAGPGANTVSSEFSDAAAVSKPPTAQDPTPPQDPSSVLDASFGAGLLPAQLGGLVRQGSVMAQTDRVIAKYKGAEGVAVDVAQVTVVRYADERAAREGLADLMNDYPVGPVVFEFGGRRVSQMITDESYPDMFPPAMSLGWVQGRYAVQVVVVPWAPDRVQAARDRALQIIGELPF